MRNVLNINNISFSYPDEKEKIVIDNLSLKVNQSEIVGIIGPNGCGKTTLLNLISNYLKPNSGEIKIYSKNKINTSFIFQEPALLDWKTVYENIELSLLSTKINEDLKNKKIKHLLKLLNIEQYENKLPKQLSGGLKQRTSIARALVLDPVILLMDEPFSALDLNSKEKIIKDIRKNIVNKKSKISIIVITHNIEEALFFCDRVCLFNSSKKNISKEIKINLPSKRNWSMVYNKKMTQIKNIIKKIIKTN